MAEAYVKNKPLKFIRIFKKADGRYATTQLTIWVKNNEDYCLKIDNALVELKEAYPDRSLSELVCDAILEAGKKAKRLNRRNRKAGLIS